MAESKGSLLAKSVQKHAGRAKEKLLQNLGKVDRTADEIFDEHLTNFNRQQGCANKLQKEFNNYIRCIRAVQLASKSLMDAISEVYEPQWTGYDALFAQISAAEALWQDFSHKLGDQVLIPLNTYTSQFPEMRKKIEKRNRKLIDYDGQRHSFQNLQANASKRKDDVKLSKGREQLEEARRTYEILNTELHDELPALYDSRILFLVTNLQTLFASEQVFHSETSKIYAELEAIVDKLATDSQRGSYTLKKPKSNAFPSPTSSPTKSLNNAVNNVYPNVITNGSSNANSPSTTSSPSSSQPEEPKSQTPSPSQQHKEIDEDKTESTSDKVEPSYQNAADVVAEVEAVANRRKSSNSTKAEEELNNTNANITEPASIEAAAPTKPADGNQQKPAKTEHANTNGNIEKSTDTKKSAASLGNNNKMEELYNIPAGATTTDLPPGVLYRVKATYAYVKEDVDELSFEAGDIIQVIEYEDPEDQEEGWLMGTKEGTTEKGLFPANFTRPI
ncbi:myc box-dependent-interacting protein 1 isoform X2 [Hermetia illucens]|uniref:myc box-dependent-interacting protein 1 isoform X2 n=1 Tax=Hermetia illucens TaxID=343691 RepID=UPI0018CC515D|nr:myc box-dependent-interacting protein 1 isoform X2 [Hermetia illucens]